MISLTLNLELDYSTQIYLRKGSLILVPIYDKRAYIDLELDLENLALLHMLERDTRGLLGSTECESVL